MPNLYVLNSLSGQNVSVEKNSLNNLLLIRMEENANEQLMTTGHEIIFILEGKIDLFPEQSIQKRMNKGKMLFLPQGLSYRFSALEKTTVVLFRFPEDFSFFHQQALFSKVSDKSLPEHLFCELEIHKRIEQFLSILIEFLNDDIVTEAWYELKTDELLYLISHYYSEESVLSFFSPAINKDQAFRYKIMDLYPQAKSVKSLAKFMNFSISKLNKEFKRVFGISPYKWLLQKKAESILKSLLDPNYTLDEIRHLYEFNSATHFVRFCRNQFGYSPTELRKKLQEKP